MKQVFIKKENNPELILFFAGWGSDENLFSRDIKEGYDYMLCFDYQDLEFDYTPVMQYENITVLAWSMGVWVATNILSKEKASTLKIKEKIAFNGTTNPINDTYGIPVEIFKGTMENFSDKTLTRFRRRICGNTENTKEFLSHLPYRSMDSLKQELWGLWNMVQEDDKEKSLKWDMAIIGMSDKIFPPENQIASWKGTETQVVTQADMEHYCSEFFNHFLLNPDKSNIYQYGKVY